MLSIQKREADQFAELTGFLETELAYAAAYHNTLLKVKEEWPDASVFHSIATSHLQLTPNAQSSALTNNPKLTHRRSIISVREPALVTVARVSTDADHLVPMRTRANTANGATPAASSQSRKRSDSLATTGTNASATTGCSGNPSSTLRENVGGWMGSLSRRKSSISKKNFQSLDDSEDVREHLPLLKCQVFFFKRIVPEMAHTIELFPTTQASSTASPSLIPRLPPFESRAYSRTA